MVSPLFQHNTFEMMIAQPKHATGSPWYGMGIVVKVHSNWVVLLQFHRLKHQLTVAIARKTEVIKKCRHQLMSSLALI